MTRHTANLTVEFKGAIMATSSKVISSQRDGEDKLREVLGEAAEPLIANRRKRDGDKAHITLVSPPDVKKAIAALVESNPDISKGEAERRIKAITAEGVQDNFRVEGIGKAEAGGKLAYFLVVNWPGGSAFRDTLGIAPGGQDFHITLGFGDGGDVHGVPKDRVLDESQLAMKQASLRSKVIRLAHARPELRNHLLPLLKQAAGKTASRIPLYGHDSESSAYVVADYPYGFKLRTNARFWLEFRANKGFRFVSQTMDPRTARWNKPKASTYSLLGGAMYLDEKNHVQWDSVTEYSSAKDVSDFLTKYPRTDKSQLSRWILAKARFLEKLITTNMAGKSGWLINGVPQELNPEDLGRNRVELEEWSDALKKL